MKQRRNNGIFICILFFSISTYGQSILLRSITVEVNRQRLDNVLEIVSNKADFYFSYNSKSIKKDSLVSLKAGNKTVKQVLEILLGNSYEFRESGNYIIIRKAPLQLTLVTKKGVREDNKFYGVSGFVYDEQSGTPIPEASIYNKKKLVATLTNTAGYFKLRLKTSKALTAELTISKAFYEDTTVSIEPRYDQQISITLLPLEMAEDRVVVSPNDYFTAAATATAVADTMPPRVKTALRSDTIKVQGKGLGKWLLSGRQKVQSLNLKKFFTTRPFQVSFTPGLGSHGSMSAQVVNNFSLNVLGGYTAGTNGIEVGGLFNIDKKGVRYVQVAGLFNSVGGQVKGLQVAGINNLVQDSVKGLQVAGINNLVKGNITGLQVAGIYNHVTDSVRGAQVSGIANFASKKVQGMQIAGVANISRREIKGVQIAGVANVSAGEVKGVQIAGVINYTKRLKGVQIGLINIADTSDGYSIGLINIVLKGYHKLSFFANEVTHVNVAFKTGNAKLYSILQAGLHTGDSSKVYAFGYGLGREMALNKKKTILLNAELSSQQLYLGSWQYANILNRLNLSVTIKAGKYFSVFAGPAYSIYVSDQKTGFSGYKHPSALTGYGVNNFSSSVTGWFGWHAGVNFF
jgi:CarboxypepD_reg-like domain